MEYVKQILASLGGGAVVIVAMLTVFKSLFIKYFESAIDNSFDKSIEKYKNKLNRSFSAYEILLKKEFDYIESVDFLYAELIVQIQDLSDAIHNRFSIDKQEQLKDYQKYFIKILECIPLLKNKALINQVYLPEPIFSSASMVISELQNNLGTWKSAGNVLAGKSDKNISYSDIDSAQEKVLILIANAELQIKNRLQELSESK